MYKRNIEKNEIKKRSCSSFLFITIITLYNQVLKKGNCNCVSCLKPFSSSFINEQN